MTHFTFSKITILLALVIGFALISLSPLNAQPNRWKLGGNTTNPPEALNAAGTDNILGTLVNLPLRIRTGANTNANDRMFINGNVGTGSNDGFVGIGNNAGTGIGSWQPTQRLHLHDQGSPAVGGVFAKWTNKN